MRIAVAGCVAQAEGAEITRRAPFVDMVVGPQTYHRLPELVSQLDPGARRHLVDTEFPAEAKFDSLPEEASPRGPAAFYPCRKAAINFAASVSSPIPEARSFPARLTRFC